METGWVLEVSTRELGDTIAADTGATALNLPIRSGSDFSTAGGRVLINGDVYNYTTVLGDDDAGWTLRLASGLLHAVSEDDEVLVYPTAELKVAMIDMDDEDDAKRAIVDHALHDRLQDGIRSFEEQETVAIEERDGERYIVDVLAQTPDIEGSYIDPVTVPSSDGIAPEFSPLPTVIGGIGALHVRFTPLVTPDPVSYDVYLSTTDNFATAAVATTTAGGSATIRALPGLGTPLSYGVTYFVWIVARDLDGSAPPSSSASDELTQITNEDIAASYAYLGTLVADQIVGGNISSDLILAAVLKTAETGARVESGPEGITLFDSENRPVITLPTDIGPDNPANFSGEGVFDGLSATRAKLKGILNEIVAGGRLAIGAGISPPETSPTPSFTYASIKLSGYSFSGKTLTGLQWDDTAGEWLVSSYNDSVPWTGQVTRHSSTGAYIATAIKTGYLASTYLYIHSVKIGSDWYSLVRSLQGPNVFYLDVPDSSRLTTLPYGTRPTLFTDGTSLYTVQYDDFGGRMYARTHNLSTGAWSSSTSRTLTTNLEAPLSVRGAYRGSGDFGAGRWVVATSRTIETFSDVASPIRQTSEAWPTDGAIIGLVWRDTAFFSLRDDGYITRYEGGTAWTTESPTWWAATTWRDTVPVEHETTMGKASKFAMVKRAMLTLSTASVATGGDEDPNAVGFYLGRGTPQPGRTSMFLQASTIGQDSITITQPTWSGANPPATNNFPVIGYGELSIDKTDAAGKLIKLLGDGSWRLGELSADATGKVTWATDGWITFGNNTGAAALAASGTPALSQYRVVGNRVEVRFQRNTVAAFNPGANNYGNQLIRSGLPAAVCPSQTVRGPGDLDNVPQAFSLTAGGAIYMLGGLAGSYASGVLLACNFTYGLG